MASVKKRVRNGRVTYRVRWRDPDRQPRSQSFDRKVDADQYKTKIEHDLRVGTYVDPSAGRQPFGDYARAWQAIQNHRPTTAALVDSQLRNHILPAFGARTLLSIRRTDVQAFIKGCEKRLAATTVEGVYRTLAAIFLSAVKDQLLNASPCAGLSVMRPPKKFVRPLEVDHVAALIEAMPDRYKAMIELTVGTGLRQGEVFGLTVDRVEFTHRKVRVDRQLVSANGGAPEFGPPKTNASYRRIPLTDQLATVLSEHIKKYPPGEDGLLFTDEKGRRLERRRFGEVWRAVAKKIQLPERTTMHDLRHFYASLLINDGQSVKTVQHNLGHASATETLDTYAHLWPDSDDRTRQAVDEGFAALRKARHQPKQGSSTPTAEAS